MRRGAIDACGWLAFAVCTACGGAGRAGGGEPGAVSVEVALRSSEAEGIVDRAPASKAASSELSPASSAIAPASPPHALVRDSDAGDAPLPPPRGTTIPLAPGAAGASFANLAAGDEAFERGQWAVARSHYEAELTEHPHSVPALVGLSRLRISGLELPTDYASAKGNREVAAAAVDLAALAQRAPAYGPAFIELGRARLLLGDAPGALDALERGTKLMDSAAEAHSQLGIAFLATGRADEAVRELVRAAELDPGSPARHGNLGTALLMVGRTKEAIAEYESRARLDDGDARAHSDLGTALLGTQDLERAVAELERAVRLAPERASFRSNLGFALQQSGRLAAAVAEYREALRRDPKLVSGWINLATALARSPQTRVEARRALERAGVLSPGDPRVQANLEELDHLEGKDAGPRP